MTRAALLLLLLSGCAGQCQAVGEAAIGSGVVGVGSIRGVPAAAAAAGGSCDMPGSPSLHYAARLETGLSADDLVATFTDQGSVGENLTEAADSAKPQYKTGGPNNQPYLYFDGADQVAGASSTLNLGLPVFGCAVINFGASISTAETITDSTSVSSDVRFFARPPSLGLRVKADSNGDASTLLQGTSQWHLACFKVVSGTSDQAYLDGSTETVNAGDNDLDSFKLGRSGAGNTLPLDGAIAEVAVWTSDPDFSAVRTEMESSDCYGSTFPIADVL